MPELIIYASLLGILATAMLDLWAIFARQILHLPGPNWAMLGRWLGHFARRQFTHGNISSAPRITGEQIIGWSAHYLIGTVFALLLLLFTGPDWLDSPTVLPALVVGLSTILAPFLIMQPAMGAGIAASKTPRPNIARLSGVAAHSVFGLGLYSAAAMLSLFR
ncbi:MAG: DUF2938 domain-containing protein [Parasphingorhabdus sp.]|uniref:DUF2938 domain-containing protein n=1 Tax=Parasphingorhabdus sp. TaxID=2709688 RepID=UPI0032992FAF